MSVRKARTSVKVHVLIQFGPTNALMLTSVARKLTNVRKTHKKLSVLTCSVATHATVQKVRD